MQWGSIFMLSEERSNSTVAAPKINRLEDEEEDEEAAVEIGYLLG